MNKEGDSHADQGIASPRPVGGAQESGRLQAFLLKLSGALRPLGQPQAIRAEAARQLGSELAVDRAFCAEVDAQARASFPADYCSEGTRSAAGQHRLDDFGVAVAEALRAGRTVLIPDIETANQLAAAEKRRCRELGVRAFLKVPLVKDGRLAGFFALHQSRPREWSGAEVALATEVAERTWAMVERAKAETALRISDEKYRSLFEAVDEGICISEVLCADDGSVTGLHYLEVNPAFGRHTGLHDVVGKTTGELLPNLEPYWLDAITRVMQTGESVRMENYLADLGRWYDLQHSRVGGPGSKLLATVFADITERKRMELNASRLAAIVESSDDAIIRKNLDGIIETWNAGAERMFGYTAQEAIGKPVTLLMPPERADEEPGILARIRRGERIDHYDTVRRRKDGSLVDVSLSISPIVDAGGNVVGASKIARDITGRKRINAMLRESDERQAFLLRLSDALRGERDEDAIANIALGFLAGHLDLDRAYVGRGHSGEELAVIGPEFHRDDLKPIAGSVHTSDFPATDRLFKQRTLAVNDVASDPALSERDRQSLAAIDLAAFVCLGLRNGEAGLTRALVAGSATPRTWTSGEIALVEEVAERTWTAIDRVRADAALRASEHRYRRLFNSIDEGFCTIEVLFDENGKPFDYRFLSANAAFEQQTGLHDAIGRRMRAMVPGHEPHWFEIYGRIARTGEAERFEQRAEALGRWYEVFAFPLGPPNQLGILFKDVLERKRAESNLALLDSISREIAIRSNPDDIMWVVGSRANTWLDVSACIFADVDEARGEVTIHHGWNARDVPSLKQTFRLADYLSPEFVRASRAGEMVVVRDTVTDDRTDAAACAQLQVGAFITVAFHRDGHWVACLGVADSKPRDWREDEIAVVRQIADRVIPRIERARAEVALGEREAELQRVSRAKDEFIAMLSHELRNPLAPIATTLQLMKLRAPDVLVRERGVIEDQVRHLTGLVNDLLDVARITSGKVDLESEHVDIADVVTAAVETTQDAMETNRQSLHVQAQAGLVVSGDRRRLVQVLVNLLTNAAKYSPPDRNVWLSATAENGEVVLRVRDQGQGIAADLLPRIFESFTQGRQSLDRSRGGLGLGLAIVRNLVTLHGGSVSAASDGAYKGSEFAVRLPRLVDGSTVSVAPATQAEPASGEPADAGAAGIKVLIVDDYAPAADSLAMLLQEMGYRTHVVNDGAAALQAVKTFKPQVALVDIGLPVIDGYEVAQTVRRMPGGDRLPLIAVTGYGQPGDHARVMDAGFDEHVVKPLDASRISELIEQMMDAG